MCNNKNSECATGTYGFNWNPAVIHVLQTYVKHVMEIVHMVV